MDSLARRCRLCAEKRETTIMIFGAEAVSMQLIDKLNKYLLLEIEEDDKLPKSICVQCCTQLQNVCDFIESTRQAQEKLLKHSNILDKVKKHIITRKTSIDTEERDNSEITYLSSADGESVTLTRLKCDPSILGEKLYDENSTDLIRPFSCELCHRKFRSDIAFKNHMWSHLGPGESGRPYKCTLCDSVFNFKNDFLSHIREHNNSRKCPICKRTFRTDLNLHTHMDIHMSNKKVYTCNKCGRSYGTRSSFRIHNISHSNERPHHCTLCQKSFKRYQELRFHMNKHTGAKPFKCPVCDKCFASSGNCYAHRARMHPNAQINSKREKQDTESNEPLYFRPIAPKAEKVKSTIARITNSQSKFKCQLCSHTFNKKDNFTYHMYKHTGIKPFHCIHCTEKFVTRKGLYLHYEKYHPGKDRPLALLSKNVQLK